MNLTIFGATGATGKPTVMQALEAGHHVTAFARTPDNVPMSDHPNLMIVQGDALNAQDVAQAITPATDVVISVLGHRRGQTQPDLLTTATSHIIAAMQADGIQRLIVMSGAGCWIEGYDDPGIFEHVVRFALKTLSGHVLEDSERMIQTIMQTDLQWTVPRAPRIVDGDHTGTYRVGYLGKNAGTTISFADFADFIIQEVESDQYISQSPVISY